MLLFHFSGNYRIFQTIFFVLLLLAPGCIDQDHTVDEDCYSQVTTLDATGLTHEKADLNALYRLSVRPGTKVETTGFYYGPAEHGPDDDLQEWTYIDIDDRESSGFTVSLSGLEPQREYRFRAVLATSTEKGEILGGELSFTTLPLPEQSSVTTLPATGISSAEATLNASYFLAADDRIEAFGFDYWLSSEPENVLTGTGALMEDGVKQFLEAVSPLDLDEEHSFRAFIVVKGSQERICGKTLTFTPYSDTEVFTGDVSDVTFSSATFHGSYILGGGDKFRSAGFYLWENDTPLGSFPADDTDTEQGLFSHSATGLDMLNPHKYQAYVELESGEQVLGEVKEYMVEISDPPTLDDIYQDDESISGRGIAGVHIKIVWPSGAQTAVNPNGAGQWSCDVPPNVDLVVGQEVFAYQTEPGKFESLPASTIVGIRESAPPLIDDVSDRDTRVTSSGIAGSSIEILIRESTWLDAAVDGHGNWAADLPFTLDSGETVSAYQTEYKKRQSAPAQTTVIASPPLEPSAPPQIDDIYEGDPEVFGSGIPGAIVTVSLPSGAVLSCTVSDYGIWHVPVAENLVEGQVVYAYQTEPEKLDSELASTTVLRLVRERSQPPEIHVIMQGQFFVSGDGIAGATVTVIFPGGSTGEVEVSQEGSWLVITTEFLQGGDWVNAYQTEPGKDPSDTVSQQVRRPV